MSLLGGGGGTGLLGGGTSGGLLGGGTSGGLLGGGTSGGLLGGGGGGGTGLLGGGTSGGLLGGGGGTSGGLLGGGGGTGLLGGGTSGGLLGGGTSGGLLGGGTSGGLLGGGGGTGLLGGGTSGGLLGGGTSGGLLGGGTSGGLLGGGGGGGLLGGGGGGLLGGGGGGLLGGQQAQNAGLAGNAQGVVQELMLPHYGGWNVTQPMTTLMDGNQAQQQQQGLLAQGVGQHPMLQQYAELRLAYSNHPDHGQLRAIVFDRKQHQARYRRQRWLKPEEHDTMPPDQERAGHNLEPTVALGFHGLEKRTERMGAAHEAFMKHAAALLESCIKLAAKTKQSNANKINELRRRHQDLASKLRSVMRSVDQVLAPRATPQGVDEAVALRQKLQDQLQRISAARHGLLARVDRLVLQRSRLQQQQEQEGNEEDQNLVRFLPELTAHLEGQQGELVQLVSSVKKAERDLGTLKRHITRGGPGADASKLQRFTEQTD